MQSGAELLELSADAILMRGLRDGRVLYCNSSAERLYGWTRDELRDRDLHETLRTIFPGSRQDTERILLETGAWQGHLVQHARDGREIVIDSHKTLNHERDVVLEVNRDVTLTLKTEVALRESEKLAAMGRLAAMIVHEINNPLAAISNLTYLLGLNPSLDSEARAYVSAAGKELERVSEITRQTLGFYRESRAPATVHITDLLDDVLALEKPALRPAGIHVVKNYAAVGRVYAIPSELRQVFLNLVTNSIQAMSRGGSLRLSVRDRAAQTVVSIVDTGTGIRYEDRRHLFEPFFSTKAAQGTGLGLWISKGIVEKYGGHIACRSVHSEHGALTCFRVVFPLSSAAESPSVPPSTARIAPDTPLPGTLSLSRG